jgi:CubicO group peptidase (beta-lactamase class C family)
MRNRIITSFHLASVLLALGASILSGHDFPPAPPEAEGLNSDALRQISADVRNRGYDIRSILVLRHGKLLLEWYAGGVTRDHSHNLFSITKSVTGTLAGIAVDRKQIPPPRTTLNHYFPKDIDAGSPLARISLHDLLTMRSGLPTTRGNQVGTPARSLFDRLHQPSNRLEAILDLPVKSPPGQTFAYGNIEPQLVAAAIEEASRDSLVEFAEDALFEPLDFENHRWLFPDGTGSVTAAYGLWLRAIDLAKLGQLYLQEGLWQGQRVLSSDWIKQATADQTGTGYGYLWWTNIRSASHLSFAAKGVRGQRVQIIPDLNLVCAVTADLPPAEVNPILNEVVAQVVAAVQSDEPLPANRSAFEALQEELQEA